MRPENWTQLLEDYIRECQTKSFKWGEFDCALCACDGIRALTGVDMAKDVRGTYSTKKEAYNVLQGYGRTLRQVALKWCKENGFQLLEYPLMAQRGDLVLLKGTGGQTLGLIGLGGRPMAPDQNEGLTTLDLSAIGLAWRIE